MRPLFLKVMDYLLLAILIGAVTLASCNKLSYAQSVHPHGELALTGYKNKGAQSERAFFVRNLSMLLHTRYASCGGQTPLGVQVTFISCLSTDPHSLHQSFDSDVQAPLNKGAH